MFVKPGVAAATGITARRIDSANAIDANRKRGFMKAVSNEIIFIL
jgi:hypothetical protein